MALSKLNLSPESTRYSARFNSGIIAVKLDGGMSKRRRDIANPSQLVTCNWVLTADQYDEFMYFYYVTLSGGALPFLMDLVLDYHSVTERTVTIIPDTLELSAQAGLSYTLSVQLEVAPLSYVGLLGDIVDEDEDMWADELGNEMVG